MRVQPRRHCVCIACERERERERHGIGIAREWIVRAGVGLRDGRKVQGRAAGQLLEEHGTSIGPRPRPYHHTGPCHYTGPARPGPVRAPSRLWPQLLWFHSRVQHCTMYSTLLVHVAATAATTAPDPTDPTRHIRHDAGHTNTTHQRIDVLSAASPPPPPTCAALLHSRPLRPVQSSPLTCHWMNE